MSTESQEFTTQTVLPPIVETKRSYGYHLSAGKWGDWLAYTNGKSVVLRSFEDPTKVRVFSEHKVNTTVARFSPNGRQVASGDSEGNVIIWEFYDDGRFNVKATYAVNQHVYDISWSEDGKRIIIVGAGDQAKCKAITTDSGNSVGEIVGHAKTVLSCDFKPNRPYRAITGGEDMTVGFHQGPPFKFGHTDSSHSNYVNCVRYSKDGAFSASVSSDKHIIIYDGKSGEKVRDFGFEKKDGGHTGAIYNCSWSADNKHLLTVSSDRTAKIWDTTTGTNTKTFQLAANPKKGAIGEMQMGCVWHKDWLVTVSLDGSLNFLDVDNVDKPKLRLVGAQTPINSFVIDRANEKMYTGDSLGGVTQWDLKTKLGSWFTGKGHGKGITGLGLAPDGGLYTVGRDDALRVSKADGLEFSADSVKIGGACKGFKVSNSNPALTACVLAQSKLVVFLNGQVASTTDLKFDPFCLCFAADDSKIWVGGKNKLVIDFDLDKATGKVTAGSIKGGDQEIANFVTHVEACPDGKKLACVDKNKAIYIINTADGEVLNVNKWQYHSFSITSLSWNLTGTRLATGAADESIYVFTDFDKYTAKRTHIKNALPLGVDFLGFIDDDTVVGVGVDRSIRVFGLPPL